MAIGCPTHGAFLQTPRGHLQGKGCPSCGREKAGKSRRLTQDEFIARTQVVHPGLYDYSHVIYRGIFAKVEIGCPRHGNFSQSPDNHLHGQGCPDCGSERRAASRRSNGDEFQAKAKARHPGKDYDYSRVEYVSARTPVEIGCPKHGAFLQTPDNHLHGQGCPICGSKQRAASKTSTIGKFQAKARARHPDVEYDYSRVEYIAARMPVEIGCPKHGIFLQTPGNHLNGFGCPACGLERSAAACRLSLEEFIVKSREVHGNRYDYSNVEYKNNQVQIIIVCPKHGAFSQSPGSHLQEFGCGTCYRERATRRWSPDTFTPEFASQPCALYYLRFERLGERRFWKVGTTGAFATRMNSLRASDYTVTPIDVSHGTRDACVRIELLIHKIFRTHRYKPELPFPGGHTECYKRDVLGLDLDRQHRKRPQPELFSPSELVMKSGILRSVMREIRRRKLAPEQLRLGSGIAKALMADWSA